MKKLSLIVAMAVILTMGGVFAAWQYAGNDVASDTANPAISITTATQGDLKAGTIEVGSTIAYKIDNKNGDFITRIDNIDTAGVVTVTFDAADLATDEVKDGVKLKWSVSITGAQNKYDGTTLLTASTDETEFLIVEGTPVEITAEAIAAKLDLAEVTLKSSEAHGAYNTALGSYTIVVTVAYVSDADTL